MWDKYLPLRYQTEEIIKTTDMAKINVTFRKFEDGEVIAIFVNEAYKEESNGYYLSYMHVGQHSDCYFKLVDELEKASKEEYTPLKKELEMIGYSVNVL